ncbi:MAG: ABC transporter substrate-binding protein [Chloroflexota bacterium]
MSENKRLKMNITQWVTFIILLAMTSFLVNGCKAAETRASKMYKVGLLSGTDAFNAVHDGFQAGMLDQGYVDGETISFDIQEADGDRTKMEAIAAKFVTDEVDLIVVTTTGAAQVVQAATADSETPVIFTIVSDPVGSGVIADLRQPGGNITGATRSSYVLVGKRIELLHEVVPELNAIWLPYQDGYPNAAPVRNVLADLAQEMDYAVVETPLQNPDELLAEIERLSALETLDFQAIIIPPDPLVQSEAAITALLDFAKTNNLAIAANTPSQVEAGALLTYSDDNFVSGELAATLAHKIFEGVDPGTIPVAFVEPELYLNFKTAQALGLTLEETVLAQASKVVR